MENPLEQPEIELLLTDIYGLVQTGSRNLSGITGTIVGTNGATFQSGTVNSALYGQVLIAGDHGAYYVDVPGNGLSFTGTANAFSAFTMGMMFYRKFGFVRLFLIVDNGATFPESDIYILPPQNGDLP